MQSDANMRTLDFPTMRPGPRHAHIRVPEPLGLHDFKGSEDDGLALCAVDSHVFKSGVLFGVGDDAANLADHIAARPYTDTGGLLKVSNFAELATT